MEVDTSGNVDPSRECSATESQVDAEDWFNYCNKNPAATLGLFDDPNDLPFFQQLSVSYFDDSSYLTQNWTTPLPIVVHSDDADGYRQIIDDLTVEIQGLKRQLRQHHQEHTNILRHGALFEVKVHDLSRQERQKLEFLLRAVVMDTEVPVNSSCLHSEHPTVSPTQSLLSSFNTFGTHKVDSAYASMSSCEQYDKRGTPTGYSALDVPSPGTRRDDVVTYCRGVTVVSDLSPNLKDVSNYERIHCA